MGKWALNIVMFLPRFIAFIAKLIRSFIAAIGDLIDAIKALIKGIYQILRVHLARIFWGHVYLCYLVGLSTVGYGGYLSYKQFWLKRTTVLIGETNIYDDGSTDERVEFQKRKTP